MHEVIDFPIERRPDIALANQAAKRQASQLLEEADRFF
ncbi:MAG: TRAP transporter TatT component family protein [Desulfobulbales bacterium]